MPGNIADWEQSVPQKTVWILGSGFSKSLGGPLLADLLSERGKQQLWARHPDWKKLNVVYEVYTANLRDSKSARSARLWEHAEEFLEFVDAAADPNSSLHYLLDGRIKEHTGGVTVEAFRNLLVCAIAGECSFDEWSDPQLERWEPYVNWVRLLTPKKDTVVTFNYDTVVERAGEHVFKQDAIVRAATGSNQRGPVEWDSAVLPWSKLEPPTDLVHLIKLHGSTRWSHNGPSYKSDLRWDQASEAAHAPLIGIPGPSKARMRKDHFDRLWRLAVERIKGATEIIFLGYRFPPSDSQARREILGAIQANEQVRLRMVTILGPDTHGKDSARITSLLTRAGNKRSPIDAYKNARGETNVIHGFDPTPVYAEPLYVEDYLSLLGP
jgi:hypothetical protein